MAANLIAQLQNEFSDDVISKLASYLGETPAKTQTALGYAIPAVVGGFFQKTQTPQGATDLLGLLQRGGFDGKSFGNIASLLRSAPAELIKSSGNLLSSLFGPRQINLTDSIAATSGLGKQASSSLLALATCTSPAWWVKKRALRAASMRLRSPTCSRPRTLSGRGGTDGLAQVLGVSTWERVDEPARAYERVPSAPARAYEREEKGGMGWLKWVLPLLLLPLLFWVWRSSRPAEPVRTVQQPAASAPGPARPAAAAVPALVKRTLTCGQELDVAQTGVEAKLIDFIDDKGRRVDDTTWFTFDRLEFETASATLLPGSQAQLRNIAAIMNCYPNVNVKVGGYTDNVGDPAANLKLSQTRADNTVAAIASNGIPRTRLESEGYGEQHPVAGNDTAEGRQRNGRIDVRVTRK